jgi:hypothetical protein
VALQEQAEHEDRQAGQVAAGPQAAAIPSTVGTKPMVIRTWMHRGMALLGW